MANLQRIIVYGLLVFFVLLIVQDSVDAKRGNKVEKVKDRQQREEKRHLKKEGKKIKKSFSKKFEQLYISLCPDCYVKLLKASESCSQNYEKLNLVTCFGFVFLPCKLNQMIHRFSEVACQSLLVVSIVSDCNLMCEE